MNPIAFDHVLGNAFDPQAAHRAIAMAALMNRLEARRQREARYEARRLANARKSGVGARECARRRGRA